MRLLFVQLCGPILLSSHLMAFVAQAEDRQQGAVAPATSGQAKADDDKLCQHARTTYQGMLMTNTHTWQGSTRERLRDDVKSCEQTGHVLR